MIYLCSQEVKKRNNVPEKNTHIPTYIYKPEHEVLWEFSGDAK